VAATCTEFQPVYILQAELLLRRMKGQQGLYPYQELLEGNLKLNGLIYDGRMCRGWTSLESNWESIVSHFQRYDTDFDCKVNFSETRCFQMNFFTIITAEFWL
jgi:hypothetical protein